MTEGIEDLRADAHLVLVVALKLIKRIVLVDILHIRTTLIAGVVGLRLVLSVRRVSLRTVDQLIAVENALLLVIVVGASEVVVVVACRVVAPGLDDTVVGNNATADNGIHPFLIGPILAFLGIRQTVHTHILQCA